MLRGALKLSEGSCEGQYELMYQVLIYHPIVLEDILDYFLRNYIGI